MTDDIKRLGTWLAAAAITVGIGACGGGGGGGGAAAPVAAAADMRNGDYVLFVADARQYTLTLDFDARSWKVVGNGADASGTLAANGAAFNFEPAGAVAANNARFTQFGDTAVGGIRLAGAVVPFVASRSFVNSAAAAAGSYKFLSVVHDPAAPSDTTIFTGEIAGSTFRQCNDLTISTIAACPLGSILTAPITNVGADFSADFGGGSVARFRIAQVAGEKVYLRAGASSGATRRFTVGIDQATGLVAGSLAGVNSAGQKTSTEVSPAALGSTLVSEANASTTRTGAAFNAGVPGLFGVNAGADGGFFTMRTAELGFVFSARGNPNFPGYVEIGKF